MRVYVVILFGLVYGMQDFPNRLTILLVPFLFLCQLIFLAIQNNRLFPTCSAHTALCLSKFVLFMYFKSFKGNFIQTQPDHSVMVFSTIFMVILVIAHRYQRRGNPRLCFAMFTKEGTPHDYFITDSDEKNITIDHSETCPVCFETFEDKEVDWNMELPELSSNMKEYVKQRNSPLMKTPCQHLFHTGCLISVMNFKMVCPVCREKLPQIA